MPCQDLPQPFVIWPPSITSFAPRSTIILEFGGIFNRPFIVNVLPHSMTKSPFKLQFSSQIISSSIVL
ncbi:MAG: hypothetical protein LHW52_03330 [Candidatus Cloacimonetes bacterium]|nr:hypothetical protein [Candidatus Cloacimonadota bacterium]